MIFLTGDIHGGMDLHKLSSKNFDSQKDLTKEDYLIICGDFGCVWSGGSEDARLLDWLNNRNFTTLFLDGNHENFDLLNQYPEEERFGGKVGRISEYIYHLKRGEIYEIDGKRFFTFGGAESIDKHLRREFFSWWPQEMPTQEEMDYGLYNLVKKHFKIDIVLTHSCPYDVFHHVVNNGKHVTELERYLNNIKFLLEENGASYKWYFGHYHMDHKIGDNFLCLYKAIVKLD